MDLMMQNFAIEDKIWRYWIFKRICAHNFSV